MTRDGFIAGFLGLALCAASLAVAEPDPGGKNKALVVDFYTMAFVKHRGVEAAERFLSENYIQHNPYTATGRQAFIDYVVGYAKEHPGARSDIKRVIAEGDLVVLHVHDRAHESDLGSAVVDIFRVANGRIVEHWDVIQPIPETDASGNSMF
jgi:predicted SnoaL-like aldol condensation-catalyzing enzyme